MPESDRFRQMADRIDHNKDSTFGGAAVIVPPQNGGEPVVVLVLDEKGDPAQFWGTILTRAQLEVSRLTERQRVQGMQGFASR